MTCEAPEWRQAATKVGWTTRGPAGLRSAMGASMRHRSHGLAHPSAPLARSVMALHPFLGQRENPRDKDPPHRRARREARTLNTSARRYLTTSSLTLALPDFTKSSSSAARR